MGPPKIAVVVAIIIPFLATPFYGRRPLHPLPQRHTKRQASQPDEGKMGFFGFRSCFCREQFFSFAPTTTLDSRRGFAFRDGHLPQILLRGWIIDPFTLASPRLDPSRPRRGHAEIIVGTRSKTRCWSKASRWGAPFSLFDPLGKCPRSKRLTTKRARFQTGRMTSRIPCFSRQLIPFPTRQQHGPNQICGNG